MGLWDQPNKRNAKGTQYKSLCNNHKKERSTKLIAGWTTQNRINCRVKFKIYSIMFLYPKKGQITMTSIRLLEIKLVHDKGQDVTTLNWRSYQQAEKDNITKELLTGCNT